MMATKVENLTEAAARLAGRTEIIEPRKKRKLSDSGRTASPGKMSKALLRLCFLNLVMSTTKASAKPGGDE
jgi:hypothetical protein